jgi:hypothetical protein
MRRTETITFAWPADAAIWRVGDTLRGGGEERIVTRVGLTFVELKPATWWRRAWYWLRRKAGL